MYEHEERVGGTAGCPRCGYRVYDAEKMMAAGRVSHSFNLMILIVVTK